MNSKFAFRSLRLTLTFVLLPLSAQATLRDPPAKSSLSTQILRRCPSGSRLRAQKCEVMQTIVLRSGTIDCYGMTLVPQQPGTASSGPTPAVAIFVEDFQNAAIQNCVIDGFDFGIFAIKSRSGDPSLKIFNNTIKARFAAISLMSVNQAEVTKNRLQYTAQRGRALYVGRSSNRNRIVSNIITANLSTDQIAVFRAPGPSGDSNPEINMGSAVVIAQTDGGEQGLLNVVLESNGRKKVRQLVTSASPEPDASFSDSNTFSNNTIKLSTVGIPGMNRPDGIVLSFPESTDVSNNTVNGARISIRVNAQYAPKKFPGRCSLDRNLPRYCLADADCNIPGDVSGSLGICRNIITRMVRWRSRNTTLNRNTLTDPFFFGISVAGETTSIRGNTIRAMRDLVDATATGMNLLGKLALETTTVSRNVVSDLPTALRFESTPGVPGITDLVASVFLAQISLNDFTGYDLAVQVDDNYNLLSELSVAGQGNYWGNGCSGLQNNMVRDDTGGIILNAVVDSHPFRFSVAKQQTPPAPCR